MNSHKTLGLITAVLASFTFLAPALAADAVQEPAPGAPLPDREWTFSVAPYFWAAGVGGDIGLFGIQPVDVDMSFGDIFDTLKFGGMTVFELSNGQWGVFADVMYVKTESDQGISRTLLGVPVSLEASVKTETLTATILGEYRAYSDDKVSIDLMAGGRIWSVDNDIDVTLTGGRGRVAEFSGSDGANWIDPMVGVKGRVGTDSPWYFTGWAMIGGFDAGSDLTWDLMGGVGYQWNDTFSIVAGYRALGVDYEDDGFVYDVVQQGPFLGTVIKF